MTKFVAYEKVAEYVYNNYVDKKTASAGMQTTVNLGSGLMAGFAAAIVSQPADTMLSKVNKVKAEPGEGTVSRLMKVGKDLGFRGAFGGLGTRLFMVGTLTAGQFASKYLRKPTRLSGPDMHFSFRRHQEGTRCHHPRDLEVKKSQKRQGTMNVMLHKRRIDWQWNNLHVERELLPGSTFQLWEKVPDLGHLKQRAKRTFLVDGLRRWVYVGLLYYEWLIWVDMVALQFLDNFGFHAVIHAWRVGQNMVVGRCCRRM